MEALSTAEVRLSQQLAFDLFADSNAISIEDDSSLPRYGNSLGFSIDRSGGDRKLESVEEEPESDAAWEDSDDDIEVEQEKQVESSKSSSNKYAELLRERFLNRRRNRVDPSWAMTTEEVQRKKQKGFDLDDEGEEQLDLFRSTASLVQSNRESALDDESIQLVRLKDANAQKFSKGVIQSTEFHPNGRTLLTASLDKSLNLFDIDGVNNFKRTSVLFEDLPIWNAKFEPVSGNQIYVCGRKKFFYSFDVQSETTSKIPYIKGRAEDSLSNMSVSPDGKLIAFIVRSGVVVLVSTVTMQNVGSVKINEIAISACFSPDGKNIYVTGSEGIIYAFDVRSRRCLFKFSDEGCIHGTAISMSPDSQYIASGSNSGVVNLYSVNSLPNECKPVKALMNLTTQIKSLAFNHDSQLMAFWSEKTKQSIRILHVPSRRVYRNWPKEFLNLRFVNCASFSPDSRYLAVGNDRGRTLLFRVQRYCEE
jgi:U3 small nucleolar RNA-associated protein 18